MSSLRRLRAGLGRGLSRIREHGPSLLLASSAAGLSYLLATALFGAQEAVFAPVAAVVSTGLSAGQRRRRALEITIGVVLGIIAASLLSELVGVGAWQLTLSVLIAMSAAVAFRTSGLLSNQAAVAAVVVMILVPLLDSSPWVRLGDALVGGAVAVILTTFFAPDPLRGADIAVNRALSLLSDTIDSLRKAIAEQSLSGAEDALVSIGMLGGARQDLADALAASRERILLARLDVRIERRDRIKAVRLLERRIEMLLSTGRSLCRAGANLIRHGDEPDPALVQSLDELAAAIRHIRPMVSGDVEADSVREKALGAAATGSAVYASSPSPAASVLIGQIRSAAIDILRITGLNQSQAVAALEEAAGRATS